MVKFRGETKTITMLYDKSFYTNMISQITIFLSSENNYIHSIKCEDINSWNTKYRFTSWGWQGGVDLTI